MIYEKFKPSEKLSPYVECYFIWHSDGGEIRNLIVESPPNGFCSMVFNHGNPYFLQNKKYDRLAVPAEFVSGQSIYSYKLFLDGIISLVGIVFKPTGLNAVFDLPTFQYTEERISLGTIFNEDLIFSLSNQLRNLNDSNEKVKLLESFVLDNFLKKNHQADYVDNAANLIVEKNGMVSVTEIMQNVFMSRRNFERHFFKKVGLSPKYYARIMRMSYLMNQIAGKKEADWKKLFLKFEYYDQSHFIKDFVEFTGRTPQEYLEGNMELANLVKKPSFSKIRY